MQKAWAIIIPLVVVAIIAGMTYGLYVLGSSSQSALEKLRDIMIIYLGLLWVIVILLLAILVGVLVWVALMIKDKVIPLLQTIQETMARVKGTAEFMSEEVASPVISFYGSVAKVRTMSRAFVGRDDKKTGKKKAPSQKEAEKVADKLRKDANLN
jgi:hypothetical protein